MQTKRFLASAAIALLMAPLPALAQTTSPCQPFNPCANAIIPGVDPPAASPSTQDPPSPSQWPIDPSGGNGLLRHLPTLFVLDKLFQGSDGVIAPGPVTLGNIMILYRIFYQSHAFDS